MRWESVFLLAPTPDGFQRSSRKENNVPILDIFGRPIEPGDIVIFQTPKNQPFQVVAIEENTIAGPGKAPMVEIKMACNVGIPIQKPHPAVNVGVDMFIVRKKDPADAAPKKVALQ